MTFSTLPDTAVVNNVDLHQDASRNGTLPQEPASPQGAHTHHTADKQHPGVRTQLAQQADFLGAIRLPSEALREEGTRVVTDILCLRKRAPGEEGGHADPAWLETAPLAIEGVEIPVNRYFLQHPAMVLGTWSRHDRLYAGEGYTLRATGELAPQLVAVIQRLPQGVYTAHPTSRKAVSLSRRARPSCRSSRAPPCRSPTAPSPCKRMAPSLAAAWPP